MPERDEILAADGRRETEAPKLDLKVVSDNIIPPSNGKARVRVIHAIPGMGDLDVHARGYKEALFGGVNFQTEAGYKDVNPLSGVIDIRPDGKKNAVATIPDAKFEAGKIYTIVV